MKNQEVEKGKWIAIYTEELMLMKYKDKKDIYMLSTINYTGNVHFTERGKEKEKPELVAKYNGLMGGVDLADSYMSFYTCTKRKMKKFYHKQFRHLIDKTCLNSFIVYKKLGGNKKRLEFHLQLIEDLIIRFGRNNEKYYQRRSKKECPFRLIERHFPNYISAATVKKKVSRRCVVHSHLKDKTSRRKETVYMCKECGVALCCTPCFWIYHNYKNLDSVDRFFTKVK